MTEGPETDGALRRGNWMLWVREGALVGQQLDVEQGVLIGEPVSLAVPVSQPTGVSALAFRRRIRGSSWYRTGGSQPAAVDVVRLIGCSAGDCRRDRRSPWPLPACHRTAGACWSPRVVQGNYDIWLMDGARTSRVTFDPSP